MLRYYYAERKLFSVSGKECMFWRDHFLNKASWLKSAVTINFDFLLAKSSTEVCARVCIKLWYSYGLKCLILNPI